MYAPLQQEADRFKAGRSAVLPQNRSFLFQMPNELPQNHGCLPDVYPPKRLGRKGLPVFYPSAPSTRRATPFECQKAAKRLLRGRFAAFSCPGCWGYGIAMPEELRPAFGVVNKCGVRPHLWKRRGRRREEPPARRRSKPKERKFQKGE